MMKYTLLLAGLLFWGCVADTPSVEYEETFNWVVETFSKNDAGFQYIIDRKGEEDYLRFTNGIREEIKIAKEEGDCVRIIRKWLAYFRKGHIGFGVNGSNSYPEREWERTPLLKDHLFAEALSEKTYYLRIPSFDYSNKKAIDEFIQKSDYMLQHHPNLIIDIRDGTGGSDLSYGCLEKYLYTNPVRILPLRFRTGELNARTVEQYAGMTGDTTLILLAKRLRESEAPFIDFFDTDRVMVINREEILANPQKIGIIINGQNVSTDEQFLLLAKQSMKVKLFGHTTFGALDVSNVSTVFSKDEKYYLRYCMSISDRIHGFAIDDIGIQPDYFIDAEIPADKWIEYVQATLESF
ncbi:MAG: S41 family peptidase [Tannerellaceae bacterium]|nr:S41 family peptidase [Tannerellaceae bacterium]